MGTVEREELRHDKSKGPESAKKRIRNSIKGAKRAGRGLVKVGEGA